MYRITEVEPLSEYRVRVKFSDEIEGIADLSDLAGKGIFSRWEDEDYFNSVYVDREAHTIAWPGGVDLCPDNLYAAITGKDIQSLIQTAGVHNTPSQIGK